MKNSLSRHFRRRLLQFRSASAPTTLASRDAYALWSATYPPQAHNQLMRLEQAAMLQLMPSLDGLSVLDLACGTGRYGLIARQTGARQVIGIDNSLPMLRAGALRPVMEADMPRLPFAVASFDVVLCGLALGHLLPDAMHSAIMEIGRILRRGGTALFSDFHPFVYLSGGRRTFSANGTTYAVEHYPHLASDYVNAIILAGMKITALSEPHAEVNGKQVPAVLIVRCQR